MPGFARFDFVVDALFGFSFRGTPRPPFDTLLRMLCADDAPPVASIDVPSGNERTFVTAAADDVR
jgi:NAD(P)H-hydrate epimerase